MSKIDLNSLKDNDEYLVIDSFKVVKKFAQYSKLEPIELYIREDLEDTFLTNHFPEVNKLRPSDFEAIPGAKYHKGVIGVFKRGERAPSNLEAPFVLLNGVTSPENVGSIVRTISGLGFKTIVLDKKSASPLLRRAIRVSMGNIVFLNIIEVDDLAAFIKDCKYPIYASGNEAGAISFLDWKPEAKSGFVIGSEGHGMDKDLYSLCRETVKIPVKDEVQHFNAGHSCAILASKYLFDTTE